MLWGFLACTACFISLYPSTQCQRDSNNFFSSTRPRHHLQFYVITTCRAWVARVLLHNTAEWLSLQLWICHCCGLHSHPRASQLTWVSSESCLGFVPNISTVTVAGQTALISACWTFLLLSSLEKWLVLFHCN